VTQYARFLGQTLAVALAVGGAGWLPTKRLAGPDGLPAMAAGCAIGWLSAAVAGWLLIAVRAETPQARMQRAFLAMVARLAVVLLAGIAAALSGAFARSPLLFWLAAAYMALLPLEVRLALL
jgi:hypothetical protein